MDIHSQLVAVKLLVDVEQCYDKVDLIDEKVDLYVVTT